MKVKLFFAALLIAGCAQVTEKAKKPNFGIGGKNAVQYVIEKHPEWADNMESAEVVEADYVLSDRGIALDQVKYAYASLAYSQNEISRDSFSNMMDCMFDELAAIELSWRYGIAVNDSLRQIEKYKPNFAKVFTVAVKMKSGVEHKEKVLMQRDSITPRAIEQEYLYELRKYFDDYSSMSSSLYRF